MHNTNAGVRRQLAGISSLFPPSGFQDQIRVIRLDGLTHRAVSTFSNLVFTVYVACVLFLVSVCLFKVWIWF